jgi:hypothetical protein
MFIHKYDKRNAASIGDRAERIFISLAGARGYEIKPSSTRQNKVNRVDFFLKKNEIIKGVDVKARKKLSAGDRAYNDDWTWVEFKNADGLGGWMYGDADYIAFEKEDCFIVVDRISLKDLAEKLVDRKKPFASHAYQAKYRIYQRRDQEEISLIKTADIKKLNRISIWKKRN